MPENLKILLDSVPSGSGAVVSAVILSALRILGDEHSRKWQRMALELPTAGCIGYAVGMLVFDLGYGTGAALVAGTVIGHLGTDWVRDFARSAINRKVK